MKFLERTLQKDIEKRLFQGKVVILYGARQVGKTTLVKHILEKYQGESRYFHCETASVQSGLSRREPDRIRDFFGDARLVVLDEAQHIPDIGLLLKVMVDTYPEIQILATGSSSFDLANRLSEPLTGRNFTFTLYPLSLEEISDGAMAVAESNLEKLLRFGSYPEAFLSSDEDARIRMDEIVSHYLYKDILSFEGMKKSPILRKLVELLALQIGQEVSYHELARQLGISAPTVERYIDILEKAFIVFRLRAFSRNKRKEISKSVKIYFFDIGIRNGVIQNYNPPRLRSDIGHIWENFCIVERMKRNAAFGLSLNVYFWRTYTKKEVDYVEEYDGRLHGYEFKWGEGTKTVCPKGFCDGYDASFERVDRNGYWSFLAR